ncbi:dihydrofolate reductase family protein [Persicirhabdus sediminis]|uniref:Dihydrofolate reductase n=1 Tax=Persicirhabdus sediminis TaxID=454144 RepID=A0A8J7MBX8_9BACT|nr:dihydrofolate reductase family protein [Persicirhabdus sediminis]MBK1790794.1 dihydrofolate reductase [Persicirhabdus sediminis]
MANIVYIATSLDGYIADKEGKLDWLHSIPNPELDDFGFAAFMQRIDAIIMGRTTFETVCSFACEWPYPVPVYVLSHSLKEIPAGYRDKAQLLAGTPSQIIAAAANNGHHQLYIDGGKTVQNFLQQGLIDELIITTIPVLLGGGTPLFSPLDQQQNFQLEKSEVLLNAMVKNHYLRKD